MASSPACEHIRLLKVGIHSRCTAIQFLLGPYQDQTPIPAHSSGPWPALGSDHKETRVLGRTSWSLNTGNLLYISAVTTNAYRMVQSAAPLHLIYYRIGILPDTTSGRICQTCKLKTSSTLAPYYRALEITTIEDRTICTYIHCPQL